MFNFYGKMKFSKDFFILGTDERYLMISGAIDAV